MEQSVDLQQALESLKKQIEDEKVKLNYILKGAELLAQLLTTAANHNEPKQNTDEQIKYSKPGLETETGTRERQPL